ncbi:MAG: HAMP domain-containing sensor histidine kinase [Clostridia bacterium]
MKEKDFERSTVEIPKNSSWSKLQQSFLAKLFAMLLTIVFSLLLIVNSAGLGIYTYLTGEYKTQDEFSEAVLKETIELCIVSGYLYDYHLEIVTYGDNLGAEIVFGAGAVEFGAVENMNALRIDFDTDEFYYYQAYDDYKIQLAELEESGDTEAAEELAAQFKLDCENSSLSFFVDTNFPDFDKFSVAYSFADYIYNSPLMTYIIVLSLAIIILVAFLFTSAGKIKEGKSVLEKLPLEIFLLAAGIISCGVAGCILAILHAFDSYSSTYFYNINWFIILCYIAIFSIAVITGLLLCMSIKARISSKTLMKNTLVYKTIHLFSKNLSVLIKFSIMYILSLCIQFYLLRMLTSYFYGEIVILYAAVNFAILAIGIYYITMKKRILDGLNSITNFEGDAPIDTSGMYGSFKKEAEKINNISQTVDEAVSERMKSEYFKTELITNVSHDIKTPLTSIINYSDLICKEETDNEKITEYSDVLYRQSNRLKKLIEDLLEASKASTGNLSVELAPCEVATFLSQTIGEYSEKFQKSQLELICTQNEANITIQADSRHLFRVFENLLNNTCKYAHENTRVYVTVEKVGSKVYISFKNISKVPLNITADELLERFVRGDSSRNSDGNGLGLSIASSLTEIQGGELKLVIDGDLFKAILVFDVFEETEKVTEPHRQETEVIEYVKQSKPSFAQRLKDKIQKFKGKIRKLKGKIRK